MNTSMHKINDWLADRPWPSLWRSVPALLAGILLLGLLGATVAERSRMTQRRLEYRRIAVAAIGGRDFERGRVACLRGLALAGDDQATLEWLFYLSAALNGLGRPTEAAALLATAAPVDHPGCIRAHLLTAQSLLSSSNLTLEMIRTAGKHLQNALALDPQSVEIKEMIGRFYINTGQPAKARQELLEVYPSRRETALLLALIDNASRNPTEARTWTDAAVDAYRKNLRDLSPQDSRTDRLGLVQALLMEESFEEAAKTLEAGLRLHPAKAYRSAMSEVCMLWVAKLAERPGDHSEAQLRVIEEGLSHAPESMNLARALIELSRRQGAAGERARKLVDARLATSSKELAAWWHFVLATDARQTGRMAEARRHLQAAYGLAPEIPEIANDMAMDLACGQPPELPRALRIIQPLTVKFPGNSNFRDTQAKIASLLGQEAGLAAKEGNR